MTEKRLEQLTKKRDQINAQIQQIKAREKGEDRKRDTRKKILIGGTIIKLVKCGEWTEAQLLELLDRELSLDRDRLLFGLSPKSGEAKERVKNDEDQET
jgi:hypothetical protein